MYNEIWSNKYISDPIPHKNFCGNDDKVLS